MDAAYVDEILARTKEVCRMKLSHKTFAGMEKEDVTQEVSIKVLDAIKSYDPTKSKIQTYLERVIDRMIIDCYKKAGAQKNQMVTNAVGFADEYVDYMEEGQTQVREVFAYIDPGYDNAEFWVDFCNNLGFDSREKKIFMLRLSGYKFNEIASMLGCTKERVSQIWSGMKAKYQRL